jgi:predicted transcriptional regulator
VREFTGAEQWQILRDVKARRRIQDIAEDFGTTRTTLQRWIGSDEDLRIAVLSARKQQPLPAHGTQSRSRWHKCPCTVCRSAEALRVREYKIKRKNRVAA